MRTQNRDTLYQIFHYTDKFVGQCPYFHKSREKRPAARGNLPPRPRGSQVDATARAAQAGATAAPTREPGPQEPGLRKASPHPRGADRRRRLRAFAGGLLPVPPPPGAAADDKRP